MSGHRYPWEWRLADLPETDDDAPTVFSTFACGGGSSMGYKRAGYHVLGNCEIDPKMAKVYEQNLHPEMPYIMDLRKFNTLDNLPERLYDLDILDGSPPCSTFSMAGSREKAWGVERAFTEGQRVQRLDDLFFVYLETVAKLRPKVFVAENVTGLLKGNARGYVNEIVTTAREMGYDIQLFMLNAAFMGVPQRRERVFFVGNRMGYPRLSMNFDERPITFGKVRSKHGKPFKRENTLFEELLRQRRKTDKTVGSIAKRLHGKESGFTHVIVQDDKVAPTLMADGGNLRFCDGKYLSVEDVRNVSSFPQDYVFDGADPYFITGMSVPPSMMANIAHEIREQWLDG